VPAFSSSLVPLASFFNQLETTPGVVAVNAPQSELKGALTETLVALASQGQRVLIILANNDFDVYAVVRVAKRQRLEPRTILRCIEITRTETVHQVRRFLERLAMEPPKFAAIFVLGLLEPFQDQDIPAQTAQRLLNDTLAALNTLSDQHIKILVTLPALKHSTRPYLTQQVARGVISYIEVTPPLRLPKPEQLRLL
jgi:hypothetical protein